MENTPDDVKLEEEVAEMSSAFDKAIRVFRLRKVQKQKHSRGVCCASCRPKKRVNTIDSISISSDYGQCLTLLGSNKSGKSTVY